MYDEQHIIIHVHIPPSAEVHSLKKKIYDRVDDAYSFDFSFAKNETNELKNEPKKELSEKMNISLSTVKRILSKLKEKELLVHEGSKRSGKWIVLKEE